MLCWVSLYYCVCLLVLMCNVQPFCVTIIIFSVGEVAMPIGALLNYQRGRNSAVSRLGWWLSAWLWRSHLQQQSSPQPTTTYFGENAKNIIIANQRRLWHANNIMFFVFGVLIKPNLFRCHCSSFGVNIPDTSTVKCTLHDVCICINIDIYFFAISNKYIVLQLAINALYCKGHMLKFYIRSQYNCLNQTQIFNVQKQIPITWKKLYTLYSQSLYFAKRLWTFLLTVLLHKTLKLQLFDLFRKF